MLPHQLENLLRLVTPSIVKDEVRREPVSPAERLTGDSQASFAIAYIMITTTVNLTTAHAPHGKFSLCGTFLRSGKKPLLK